MMLPLCISHSVQASKKNPKPMPNPSQRQLEMLITQSLLYQSPSLPLGILLSRTKDIPFLTGNKMLSLEKKFVI